MPTEANSGEQVVEKITFTKEQQDKIDEIIRDRMGAAGREAREAAETARAEAKASQAKLEAAENQLKDLKATGKSKANKDDVEELQSTIAEMKAAREREAAELDRLRQVTLAKDREIESARSDGQNIRKQIAMRDAAGKLNFFEVEVVTENTDKFVKWDAARSRFIVVNESGTERLNSAYEPLSLDEFYAEYASKRPYMVRGGTKSGTGSSESQRIDVSANGKHTVEQIFGSKSIGALANRLKKENPAEYARLKAVAREANLI